MDTDDEYEDDYQVVSKEALSLEEKEEFEEVTSYALASQVMDVSGAGFVLIASPHMFVSEKGYTLPSDIGIILNGEIGMTRSAAAFILREVADSLDAEMDRIENFVKEAIGE